MSGRDYLVRRGRHPPGLLAVGLTGRIVQAASIEGYAKRQPRPGQPGRAPISLAATVDDGGLAF
jgi:hypothetical protein